MVGCFGFSGPLRQYFSLYRAVSQREGEREERKDRGEKKCPNNPPPTPAASAIGPCPTITQIVGRPGTGSFPREDMDIDIMITIYNTAVTDADNEILGKERCRKKPWVTKDVLVFCNEKFEEHCYSHGKKS